MDFVKVPVNQSAVGASRLLERVVNRGVRAKDRVLERAHLGGRRADYDDEAYEFQGGAHDALRRKHYDKSLRLLWKAQPHAPWSSFRDANPLERQLQASAESALTKEEKAQRERITSEGFRELLQREYSPREREAIVHVLAAIGHGEAYAWLVAAELIGQVRSTGAKAALAAQVIEEAKHFVVMRELVGAFGVPLPRLPVWEYLLLERVLKTEGIEKFFGMNVLVEGIALSAFGALSHLPGLEILRLFHLDESRHSALPMNYLREFPLSAWQKRNPFKRTSRFRLVLPAVPLIFHLEADLAELGIDAFEFGGTVMRKVSSLAERAGFLLPVPHEHVMVLLNVLFNSYCLATRPGHSFRQFQHSETTKARTLQDVEASVLGAA